MQKYFILDTNVLLHDANSIYKFTDNIVIIPVVVLEELDTFKKRMDEVGKNCRVVSRILDGMRNGTVKLSEGAPLPNGGTLKILLSDKLESLPPELRSPTADNRILSIAKYLKDTSGAPVTLISKDLNMRIKAEAIDIPSEDYEVDKVNIEELYSGITTLAIDDNLFETLKTNSKLKYASSDLFSNQCVIVNPETNNKEIILYL